MRKINIDKNIVIISIIGVILAVEIIIVPIEISLISGINKKIRKLRQDLALIEKEWPSRDNFSKQKETLKQEIAQMHTKFILPQQESTLFSFLSTESKNFNVQIKVLKPGTLQDYVASKLGKFDYLPIIINAKSSFQNLANFLDYVQSSKYFFDVTELQIISDLPYHTVNIIICGLLKEN